jgi:hypothetical protein
VIAALAHARLAHQRLGATRSGTAAARVAALGAVQAQDYAGAKWSLRLRAERRSRRGGEDGARGRRTEVERRCA